MPPGNAGVAAAPASDTIEGAQVMAWVADQPILASDILPRVDLVMEENKDKIPASNWNRQRVILAQQALKAAIETKLVLVDALHKIPAANVPDIEKQVNEQFETDQVPLMLKNMKCDSREQLDLKLKADGSSLEQQRRIFFERSLTMQWVHQALKDVKPVSHDEMLAYYQQHLPDYEHPARARWEQLTVEFNHFASKREAYVALSRMGNDVMRGVPWAQVARAGSQGFTAADGGRQDWTSQGSLSSAALDQALFSLPIGAMSPILEDDHSFQIVRVVEREEANRTPFRDAQVTIRGHIEKQHQKAAQEKYYEELRKDTRVWTVFDDPESLERFARSIDSHPTR